MIVKKEKPCWIGLCDNCKEDLFGMEYVSHFEDKNELLERIDDELEMECVETFKGKHFCSKDCLTTFQQKKKECELKQ